MSRNVESAASRSRSRRLKVIWGGREVIQGRWFLGLFGLYARADRQRDGLAISVRGALLWSALLLVVGFFSATWVLSRFFAQRPHNLITYADLVQPWRWSHYQELRGRQFIAQGFDALEGQRWNEAFQKLRLGVGKYPHDRKARQALAQFYLLSQQRPQAMQALRGGLGPDYPGREYLDSYFTFARGGDEFDEIVRVTDEALARPEAAADRRWLLQQKLRGLLEADRPAEALALVEQETPAGDQLMAEGRILALLELDRPRDALTALEGWSDEAGDRAAAARLRVRAAREAGDFPLMEQALEDLRRAAPSNPRPYVYRVVQIAMAGQEEAARAALTDYLFRFGATAENVTLLAEPLGEIRRLDFLELLVAHARDHGQPVRPLHTIATQAAIGVGEWGAALRHLGAVQAAVVPGETLDPSWLELMRAIITAATAPDEGAAATLVTLCRSRALPLRLFRLIVPSLAEAGRLRTAFDLITLAERSYPASHFVQEQKQLLAPQLAAIEAGRVKTVLESDAPAPELEQVLAEVDAALARGDWSGVATRLAEVRRARPPWLEAQEAALGLRQLRAELGADDQIALQGTVRSYLIGDPARAGVVVGLAREAHAAGEVEMAGLLLRELRARAPQHPAVLELQALLAPPPAVDPVPTESAPAETPPPATPGG